MVCAVEPQKARYILQVRQLVHCDEGCCVGVIHSDVDAERSKQMCKAHRDRATHLVRHCASPLVVSAMQRKRKRVAPPPVKEIKPKLCQQEGANREEHVTTEVLFFSSDETQKMCFDNIKWRQSAERPLHPDSETFSRFRWLLAPVPSSESFLKS